MLADRPRNDRRGRPAIALVGAGRRGAVLRGVVASVAVLTGMSLLVYGAAIHKREVTIKEEVITRIPPKQPPAALVEEFRQRGWPPPQPEPARVEKSPAKRVWDLEPLLVRNVTVGALRVEADGLHRAEMGSGPALCPT